MSDALDYLAYRIYEEECHNNRTIGVRWWAMRKEKRDELREKAKQAIARWDAFECQCEADAVKAQSVQRRTEGL